MVSRSLRPLSNNSEKSLLSDLGGAITRQWQRLLNGEQHRLQIRGEDFVNGGADFAPAPELAVQPLKAAPVQVGSQPPRRVLAAHPSDKHSHPGGRESKSSRFVENSPSQYG